MRACAAFVARRGNKASDLVRKVTDRLSAPDWQERVAAARALGDFGSFADRGALGRAAVGDAKAFVREAAVSSLGRLGARASVEVLVQAADRTREKVPEVRRAAVEALAPLAPTDRRVRAVLADIADQDPSAEVKAAARGSEKK